MSRTIELLAPAKDLQCGIAAIDHGADAVYIGASHFGARHAAGNSVEDIAMLCLYAHQYGAKVYATVNTVIYDSELSEALQLVRLLDAAGIDAFLLQDMGLLDAIREEGIPTRAALHASTQTDNRSKEKAMWLQQLGFSRVVLAREMTLEDIKAVHQSLPELELEVFVHGALCVSYSGQCYASQHCFGRSANRGECAQLCRMKYQLIDASGSQVADDAYYLSLKDQCQIDNLKAIIDAGACSLKIEGRLKDATYVKNVVSAYSQRLDAIVSASGGKLRRSSWGRVEHHFTPDLRKSFNRGYTDYFLNGRKDDIASFRTPKAIGEFVGKVKALSPVFSRRDSRNRQPSIVVSSLSAFANGDGLCYLDNNGELKGFRVNRAEGNHLYPAVMPTDLQVGMSLYRSQDQAFDRLMAGKTATRSIALILSLTLSGNILQLTAAAADAPLYGEATLPIELQTAQKPQMDNIRKQLTKLGGTIYTAASITVSPELDMTFIPSSMLAELRRRTIDSITQLVVPQALNDDMPAREVLVPIDRYHQKFGYLHNAANQVSKTFYTSLGVEGADAYELIQPQENMLLMQCRHCIRYSLGYCVKRGGRRPQWHEPLYLRLADGRQFRLDFDCANCQMNVMSV